MIVRVTVKWAVICPHGHGRCGEDLDPRRWVVYRCRSCAYAVSEGRPRLERPLTLTQLMPAAA